MHKVYAEQRSKRGGGGVDHVSQRGGGVDHVSQRGGGGVSHFTCPKKAASRFIYITICLQIYVTFL